MKLFLIKYYWHSRKYKKVVLAINKERAIELAGVEVFEYYKILEINTDRGQVIDID